MNTQELMKKEILTVEEYNILDSVNPEWVKKYLFHNFWNNTYLNLDIYSEAEHHERVYRMECGY